jgi:glucan phosphoethanolaminetransferase (alkaline phosphatase superfamily)
VVKSRSRFARNIILVENNQFRSSQLTPSGGTLAASSPKLRKKIMWKKTIKYLLNFAGVCLMIFYSNLGYGIIARLPECENVKTIIYNVVGELSKLFLIYLIIITIVNFLFERKIEKRSETKEFVILAIINIVSFVLITSFFSNQFYRMCCPGQ